MPEYDLVCIGSGPAGEAAATTAAALGRRVAVVERQGRPGGNMVNTGTVASKVLRETALLLSAFRRRPIPGIDSSPDRSLSVARFMARRHLAQIEEHDRIEQAFDRLGVDVVRGLARIASPHSIVVEPPTGETAGTRVIETGAILIATGSRPLRPASVHFDDVTVLDADSVLELDRIPRSMIVVGGGVIATEYACIFAEIGVQVTLLETRDCILPFLDAECRALLERAMRLAGITIRCNAPVQSVTPRAVGSQADAATTGTAREAEVVLADGERVVAETVLWALGRTGNTDHIGLESVGITPDARGLLQVDESYRTTVPSILAAGDVIGFPALASTSIEQGRIAARRLFGATDDERLARTVPLGIYTIPAVASVGMTEQEAMRAGRPVVIGRAAYRGNVRGRMLGDDTGLAKLIFDATAGDLLGAWIVGEDATELIHLAQMAIVEQLGIEYFVSACMNYPSLTALYKSAAEDARRQMRALTGTRAA